MTATETAYDPIPDLAWLLGAAQRQVLGYDAQGGIRTYANRLIEGLNLPELATAAEAYAAICKALEAAPASVPAAEPLMTTHSGRPVDARNNIPEER